MNIIKQYFIERYSPLIRTLHYLLLFLVLSQIIGSNFMGISNDGVISNNIVEYYGTWMHIITGLFLVILSTVFFVVELKKHGVRYFYPYLFGTLFQVKSDINQLKSLKLPELKPEGLAAIVQGLGLGAIFLVVFSGLTWFILWSYNLSLAGDIKELHKLLTGVVEAYVLGHGSIGLVHIFLSYRKQIKNYK